MNKKGFVATSLIYSFFLIFITLFFTIIGDYLQSKLLLNTLEESIKQDINAGLTCEKLTDGTRLVFQGNFNSSLTGVDIELDSGIDINGETLYSVDGVPNCSNSNQIVTILDEDYNSYEIQMKGHKFTKLSSDDGFYTITGVKQ